MIYEIHHYPENFGVFEEPTWIDVEVNVSYAAELESFCRRNMIPFHRLGTISGKTIYQFREGDDHEEVEDFILLHEDDNYIFDVIKEMTALAFSQMRCTYNFAEFPNKQ